MDRYIYKAKCINDESWHREENGNWVYGYYVPAKDEYGDEMTHAIFGIDCRYRGAAEYDYWKWYKIDPNTVCRYTEMNEFVMTDKSINQPLFEGNIVEVHSTRCPYAAYPQSKYDGPVKARAVIYFDRGQWRLDYKNKYNEKMCQPRGNEQYERSVENAWELYYFGYHGKDEDKYRELNKRFHYHDIIKLGNIYDNPELLEE